MLMVKLFMLKGGDLAANRSSVPACFSATPEFSHSSTNAWRFWLLGSMAMSALGTDSLKSWRKGRSC
jgi:hypothetical protein